MTQPYLYKIVLVAVTASKPHPEHIPVGEVKGFRDEVGKQATKCGGKFGILMDRLHKINPKRTTFEDMPVDMASRGIARDAWEKGRLFYKFQKVW